MGPKARASKWISAGTKSRSRDHGAPVIEIAGAEYTATMYKLIVIVAAAMPIVLFLRAILVRRSQKALAAFSAFKKQIDYLVWVILFVIGCVFVYSVASLI